MKNVKAFPSVFYCLRGLKSYGFIMGYKYFDINTIGLLWAFNIGKIWEIYGKKGFQDFRPMPTTEPHNTNRGATTRGRVRGISSRPRGIWSGALVALSRWLG